jgi:hypothetical protein
MQGYDVVVSIVEQANPTSNLVVQASHELFHVELVCHNQLR